MDDFNFTFFLTVLQSYKDAVLMIMKGCVQSMNKWMTCDLMSFSTVFQSFQNDRQIIMKGCVQWNPVYNSLDHRLMRG